VTLFPYTTLFRSIFERQIRDSSRFLVHSRTRGGLLDQESRKQLRDESVKLSMEKGNISRRFAGRAGLTDCKSLI
jgi:hypothetical protein